MKYYKLERSIDIKELGWFYPKTAILQDYDFNHPHSIRKIPLFGEIEYPIRFPDFKVRNSAFLTDYLHCVAASGKWLLYSPKAWDLIKELNLPEYQVFPVKVYHKRKPFDYFSLYFPLADETSFIDWRTSKFQLIMEEKNFQSHPAGEISFKTFSDFMRTRFFLDAGNDLVSRGDFQTGAHNLSFKLHLSPLVTKISKKINFDLFRQTQPVRGYCASEKFKKIIQENNLTGFRFLPLPGADE